jgi:hypothetical protein
MKNGTHTYVFNSTAIAGIPFYFVNISNPTESLSHFLSTATSLCILFVEQIDLLCEADADVLVHHLDFSGHGSIVVGITDRYDSVNSCLKRSGRFGEHFRIPPADDQTRLEIIKEMIMPMKHTNCTLLPKIVANSKGFFPCDLKKMLILSLSRCPDASGNSLLLEIEKVSRELQPSALLSYRTEVNSHLNQLRQDDRPYFF